MEPNTGCRRAHGHRQAHRKCAKDALTVRRVYGDPYEKERVTFIPAARVAGGGGGGSGRDENGPQGEGGGFGMNANPAGAFVIKDGKVRWQPAVDPNRVFTAVAAVIVAVVVTRGWVLHGWPKRARTAIAAPDVSRPAGLVLRSLLRDHGPVDRELAAVLVEEYLAGGTMREVAAHHGVSTKLVQRAMRQLGAATRTPEERAGYPAQVEAWAASYAQGVATAEIAARSGVSEQTVRQRLRRHGVAVPRPARRQQRKRDERTIRELIDRYAAGETLAELGRELGVSAARVQQLMKDSGAPLAALTPRHTAARSQLRDQSDRATLNDAMATNPTLSIRELADCPRDGPRPGQAAARPAGPGSTTTTPATRRAASRRPVVGRHPGVCEGVGGGQARAAVRCLLRDLGLRTEGDALPGCAGAPVRHLGQRRGGRRVPARGQASTVVPPAVPHGRGRDGGRLRAARAGPGAPTQQPSLPAVGAGARRAQPRRAGAVLAVVGPGHRGARLSWPRRRHGCELPDPGPADAGRRHPGRRRVRGVSARLAAARLRGDPWRALVQYHRGVGLQHYHWACPGRDRP